MSTGDRIGVEMFEFTNNEPPGEFQYWKTTMNEYRSHLHVYKNLVTRKKSRWELFGTSFSAEPEPSMT